MSRLGYPYPFVFELWCWQTDKQTDSNVLPRRPNYCFAPVWLYDVVSPLSVWPFYLVISAHNTNNQQFDISHVTLSLICKIMSERTVYVPFISLRGLDFFLAVAAILYKVLRSLAPETRMIFLYNISFWTPVGLSCVLAESFVSWPTNFSHAYAICRDINI